MTVEKIVLSPREAGQMLGISTMSIYRRINDGTMRAVKVGKLLRIPKIEIDRLLNSNEEGAA